MAKSAILIVSFKIIFGLLLALPLSTIAGETILSSILTPTGDAGKVEKKVLSRQGRSGYYDPRYYNSRQFLDRLSQYDQPRCGRCSDDRFDDRDDAYDRNRDRDRYDDDRRNVHRPTYGNRFDKNSNYDKGDGQDQGYNSDRRDGTDRREGSDRKNGTNDDANSNRDRPYDDKNDDRRPSGGRKGADRDQERNRNKYDDRDRYKPDYYDRFLRDPYRDRDTGYDDPYRERRPAYDRNPYPDRYDDGYGGRFDGYNDYRRPAYDDRGNGYDDRGYGRGRGPHDRPWDETYRGQAGWDAGGRGYYFASGRPEFGAAPAWDDRRGYANQYPREYARPDVSNSGGWQNVDRPLYGGQSYRDPADIRGGGGATYPQSYGYRQDQETAYRPVSGWHNVGERRPYRDQSSQVGKRGSYGQTGNTGTNAYGQSGTNVYGQPGTNVYGQSGTSNNADTSSYTSSSTTPGTSYLYQREDEQVTSKDVGDATTKSS